MPVHAFPPVTQSLDSSESNEDSDSENTPPFSGHSSDFTPGFAEGPPNTPPEISSVTDDRCLDTSEICAPESSEPKAIDDKSDSVNQNRPRRAVKLPKRFNDFIMS